MSSVIKRVIREAGVPDAVPFFYSYYQNNSGGRLIENADKGIGHLVIVEAYSADDADRRAEQIGLYFDGRGDCNCCGDRWSNAWDYQKVPSYNDTPVEELDPFYFPVYVHYLDGSIVEWSVE